ncbi:hypothetical protein KKB44_02890 [Candidatus Micrarchaeota archaeon]|nr:hypothetical protein [Candidatus Micrarchaeota archaeon]
MSKGQTWSVDFSAATVVLAFILLFSVLIWNSLAIRWNTTHEYRQMQTDAMFAAEALLTTSGEPKSWETLSQLDGNITSVGLVNGRNELNNLKIERLVSANDTEYELVKTRLGMQKYGLGVRIMELETNETYYEFGTFAGDLDSAIVYKRLGILNESPVIVHVEVWQ